MTQFTSLDESVIDTLREIMGQEFNDLIQAYRIDCQTRISALKQELSEDNCDGVRRAAHSLKGSSGNVGASHMQELCLALETSAKNEDLSSAPEMIANIESEYQNIESDLNVITRN
ncbi:Hpt domain-containing protein [Marinibactrum halimedae]|uniref:HPt domain-containing protein n=1 Tax=Marinibactrum halimedae TaxID=1444977 RepID=A0AA37WQR5_9GAMM|nr:Hpt domain-containing protein [Marinibactrum halimedae]MCD9458845.1 Hpt domain-containing protein [Marinibactrum halimedae]GLS27697.1 hypothetical protein GCM10007877_34160 [Marinibactrum halimedae]